MDGKICSIVGESITFATGHLTRSFNAPKGATGLELRTTAAANDSFQFVPRLQRAWKFTAVGAVYRDDTATLTERGTTNTATYNSMVATNDFIYVACDVPFRGVCVNVVNANGTASVLSAFYWDGTQWAGLTETDGTASGGATLAIDNNITWTVPTDWATTVVNGAGPHFWVRFNSDGGTDSATSLAEVVPLAIQPTAADAGPNTAHRTTMGLGTTDIPARFWFNPQAVGGMEVLAANAEVVRLEWLVTSPVPVLFVQ